ncbi:MAG: anthranilate/aminodeoxychorismate synthase component II [Gammaproteobacteria bacterium]|nr:anthranilate/aminodeoxychorismate synthase component II [Gammaproteobacteria bacterium]|tara:strand:- start:43 stop:618 length:576 start_codon:yes stop_codon:yes gene_type:complete
MILMIDNYDSFTYNVVQYFGELGAELTVHRNDMIDISEIEKINPEKIVISPGPCTPNEAGVSVEVVKRFYKTKPILGICLGHQSIGQAFNGRIVTANLIMHGKTSSIYHNKNEIFLNVNSPFEATRYHSLVVEKKTLPECLEVIAWSEDSQHGDEIMGIKHIEFPTYGLQFHPESILTKPGHQLLKNFLEL